MKRQVSYDERMERVDGQVTTLTLAATQAAMGLLILVRRYVLHQDGAYYQAFSWILLGSFALTVAAKLFLRGLVPKLNLWRAVIAWLASVAVISIPSSIIHGLPTRSNWTSTILPATLGPAIVIAAYCLFAYMGQRLLDRYVEH